MPKTTLVQYSIKNLKFAMRDDAGGHDEPEDLAYGVALSLEADYNETNLYGDGQIIGILGDDKGKTGTLTVTALEEAYEIACGRARLVDGGIADVQQRMTKKHALYYETEGVKDGENITVKNWLFGAITGKASETYQQTEDDPTINPYEYSLTVLGTNLKDDLGDDYVDENGNTVKVFRIKSFPGDSGYETFGDSVPTPTEVSAT